MTQQEFLAIAKQVSRFGKAPKDPPIEKLHSEGLRAIWVGNIIIFVGLGLSVLWGLTAPLAEGVPGRGTVVIESLRKSISHITGGTVEAIHVRENQFVKAGDVLITLKSEKAKIAQETILQEYIAAASKLARLRAEEESASDIEFNEDLVNLAEQNGKLEVLKAQRDLFILRRISLNSEQAILKENIHATSAQIAGLHQQLAGKQQQLSLMKQEGDSLRPLAESGYTAKNNILDMDRRIVEISSATSELQTRISRELSNSAELRLRLLQKKQDFLRDVEAQSTETRNEVMKLQGQLRDAQMDVESKTIRAPVSGQVVALVANTPNVALNAGTKIMEIIPENEALLIDVQIPVQVVASVSKEQMVDVRITVFPGDPQLVVTGIVQSISSDVREPQGAPGPLNPPYYLARVAVTPEGMQELGQRQLRPGMSVDVIIKTGERSMMAYLLRPILKQLFFAMKEH